MPYVTLFDTEDRSDAILAGFEGPTEISEGGCKVFWDTTGNFGGVEIAAQDGRFYGTQLIKQVVDALTVALRYSEIKDVRRDRGEAP